MDIGGFAEAQCQEISMNIKRTSAAAAAAVMVVLFAGAAPASADIANTSSRSNP